MPNPKPLPLLILTLLLLTHAHPILSLPLPSLTQLRTLHSLLLSLSTRITTLRASRGDTLGAQRSHLLTRTLESLTSPRTLLSLSGDFFSHYSWRNTPSFFKLASDITPDVTSLLSSLSQFSRLSSDSDRAAWVARNYRNLLRVSKSLFSHLLSVLNKSGAVRDTVEALQREIVDGEFLKDCLEVGANDLKGLVEVLKDMVSRHSNAGRHEL